MAEAKVQADIRLDCDFDTTLFRNNVGAYRDDTGRLVRYGLCVGSSDLVGDKTVTITPDMVGQRIAVAVYIECKDAGKKPTPEQVNFIEQARKRGALAGVAQSVADARAILRGEHIPIPPASAPKSRTRPQTSRDFTANRVKRGGLSTENATTPARTTGARKTKTF